MDGKESSLVDRIAKRYLLALSAVMMRDRTKKIKIRIEIEFDTK